MHLEVPESSNQVLNKSLTHREDTKVKTDTNFYKDNSFLKVPKTGKKPLLNLEPIPSESTLEAYKKKYDAKNWSEFANKKIQHEKSISSVISPKGQITDVVVFKSKIGKILDFSKQRSPALSKISFVNNQTAKKREKRNLDKLELSSNQIELLESIGSLNKMKESYFPLNINEVEYFVKISVASIYKNLFCYDLICPEIEKEVSSDIIYFGMASYKSSMNLTNREECIVLNDWIKSMLKNNCNSVDICLKIRRTQIILTFAINECIKQTKAECNQRAVLINLIWLKNLDLFKIIESYINEAVNKKEIELTNHFIQKNKALESLKESLEKEKNELQQKLVEKEEEINQNSSNYKLISLRNNSLLLRIDILSSIIEIFVQENIEELREICDEKKSNIIKRLVELRKQRKERNDFIDNNEPSDYELEIEKLLKYQFSKPSENDKVSNNEIQMKPLINIKEFFHKVDQKIQFSDATEQAKILPTTSEKETFIEEEFILTDKEKITNQILKVIHPAEKRKVSLENSEFNEISSPTNIKRQPDDNEEQTKQDIPKIIFTTSPRRTAPENIHDIPFSSSTNPLAPKSPLAKNEKIIEEEKLDDTSQNTDFNILPNSEIKNDFIRKSIKSPSTNLKERIISKKDNKEEFKFKSTKISIIDTEQQKTNDVSKGKKYKVRDVKSNKKKKEKSILGKKLDQDLEKNGDKPTEMKTHICKEKIKIPLEVSQEEILNEYTSSLSNAHHIFKVTTLKNFSILPKSQSSYQKDSYGFSPSPKDKDKENKLNFEINKISQTLKSKETELSLNKITLNKYKKFVDKLKKENDLLSLRKIIDKFINKMDPNKEKGSNNCETNMKFENESLKHSNEYSNMTNSQKNQVKKSLTNNSNDDFSKNIDKYNHLNINLMNKEVKFQNELIKKSPIKLVDDSMIDYLLDKRFLEMEDINTEFPKKIINIMKILINKVKTLVKDEYGDNVLDMKSNSVELNEIREISYILIKLLKTLFIQKDLTLIGKYLHEISTQTETIYSSETISTDQAYIKKLLSIDREIQCEISEELPDTTFKINPNRLRYTKTNASNYNNSLDSFSVMKSKQITRFKEFNFYSKIKNPLGVSKYHPGTLFLDKFCETFTSTNTNVMATSVKVLMKTINQIYNEKMQSSKDSAQIKMQPLFEFMYDFFVNKYGLINCAEKKLYEVLASVTKNKQIPKIELFARFIGLGSQSYSPDDLDFLFIIALLFQNATFGFNFKKDVIAFEATPYSSIENASELISQFFVEKVSPERIQKAINDLKEKTNKKLSEGSIDINIMYMDCINLYREIKNELYLKLYDDKKHTTNYSELLIGSKDIENIMPKVKPPITASKEIVDNFFDKFSSLVYTSGNEEPMKIIPLEYILSILLASIQPS